MKLRKYRIIYIFSIFLSLFLVLTYGILIGKYQIFPYNLLKQLQDSSEETIEYPLQDRIYTSTEVEQLIKVNQSNRDSTQSVLNQIIFGPSALNYSIIPTIKQIEDTNYTDLKNIKYLEEFTLNQPNNLLSKGYIFHPNKEKNRLLIYQQGHDGSFILGKSTIAFFLEKGFTIYAFAMPLKGSNNNPIVEIEQLGHVQLYNHEEIKYLEYPMQYFIGPIISMINYAEQYNYKDITMVGISGGGWTTTLAAAADNRINYSFPVAGTLPLFVKFQEYSPNYGDFEQTYQPLLSKINYLDMYVLGSTGENRVQLQILNKYDPCCFNGTGYKQYQNTLREKVSNFDFGNYNVILDTINQTHSISNWSLEQISEVLK